MIGHKSLLAVVRPSPGCPRLRSTAAFIIIFSSSSLVSTLATQPTHHRPSYQHPNKNNNLIYLVGPVSFCFCSTAEHTNLHEKTMATPQRLLFLIVCMFFIPCNQCLSTTEFSTRKMERRDVLLAGAASFAAPFPAVASPPMNAAEAIRRSAANIPGYGQSDVFYPKRFLGSWTMVREVEIAGREPFRLVYPIRFVSSIEDNLVVADRGFNQAELEKAILREVKGNNEPASLRSCEWEKNNPNDLRLVFSDGFKKEIKTTKRAAERTDTTVSSSEFQRLTLDDGRVPTISARRVLTKWEILDDVVSGIEIVYDMAGASTSTTPTVISKSRLLLKR